MLSWFLFLLFEVESLLFFFAHGWNTPWSGLGIRKRRSLNFRIGWELEMDGNRRYERCQGHSFSLFSFFLSTFYIDILFCNHVDSNMKSIKTWAREIEYLRLFSCLSLCLSLCLSSPFPLLFSPPFSPLCSLPLSAFLFAFLLPSSLPSSSLYHDFISIFP